jgi:hypothetical protein
MIANIYDKLFDYLKEKIPEFQKTKVSGRHIFSCPNYKKHYYNPTDTSATVINGTEKIACSICNWIGTIYDAVRVLEPDKKDKTDEEITIYLMESLKLDMYSELDFYVKYGWSLTPVAKNSNNPFKDDWINLEFKNKIEWIKWLNNGYNIGLNNNLSKTLEIDVDTYSIPENLKSQREELIKSLEDCKTLMQNTPHGGRHYVFLADSEIPQKVDIAGLHIDTRTEKGAIAIAPSRVDNNSYSWVNLGTEIKPISLEIKSKLLELMRVDLGRKEQTATEKPIIITPGGRNDTLCRIGGVLIHKFNPQQTEYLLGMMNNTFMNPPLEHKEIQAMLGSLAGYKETSEQTQEKMIYEYLKQQQKVHVKDIVESLFQSDKTKRAIVDKYLSLFVKTGKAIRLDRGYYQCREEIIWSDEAPKEIVEYKYKIPLFHDIMTFEDGDVLILGGVPNCGKTTIAMNIVREMVVQGIKPYYIYSESGSRFQKLAKLFNIEGKYWYKESLNPLTIELAPDAFTIIDWLDLGREGFEKTSTVLEYLGTEMRKKRGILIILTQLKPDSNGWFAPNLIEQYPGFAARYIQDNEFKTEGHWDISKIKEPKGNWTVYILPCSFNQTTKIFQTKDLT